MKERPILFSGPMVRAVLAGAKTQTRRIVKPQPRREHGLQAMWGTSPDGFEHGDKWLWREVGADYPDDERDDRRCPFGVPGDRLWVREAFTLVDGVCNYEGPPSKAGEEWTPIYRATEDESEILRWYPGIHMPRWASRITLEITDVRVERLLDINEEGAIAEGIKATQVPTFFDGPGSTRLYEIEDAQFATAKDAFCFLWDGINGKRAPSETNPWVWAITFRRLP